jgi:hypothetical protein
VATCGLLYGPGCWLRGAWPLVHRKTAGVVSWDGLLHRRRALRGVSGQSFLPERKSGRLSLYEHSVVEAFDSGLMEPMHARPDRLRHGTRLASWIAFGPIPHKEDAMPTKHVDDKSQDKSQKDKDKSGTSNPSPNKPQPADKR